MWGNDSLEVGEPCVSPNDRLDAIDERFDRMEAKLEGLKDDLIHEFRVIAEDIRHDAIGSTKDQLADHESRITRLEASPRRAA